METFLSFDKLNTVDANNAFYGRRTDYEKFYEIAERYLQNCVDNPGTAALCTVDPRAAGSNGQAFGNPYQYVFQQNDNLVLSSESIYEIPETRGVQTERPYAFGRLAQLVVLITIHVRTMVRAASILLTIMEISIRMICVEM